MGKGAMGVVYEGFDPRLSRKVAIKTILKSHLDDETATDYSKRFEREAQAVARLNHSNIVQVHDFGEEGDVAYLVMEFIRGRDLKAVLRSKELPSLNDSVRIMRELCDALQLAHNAGVVHRDVKPGNVMLDEEMHVKLTDFGVASLQDVTRSHATAAGTLVGTPAYMSPEQIRGARVDRRSDIFSAGIVLYELLTGKMPFGGGGPWTVAKQIMQDQPRLPSAVNTSVLPSFDAVVNKALAKDPAARYQSAREFAFAVQGALEAEQGADKEGARIVPGGDETVTEEAASISSTGSQEAEIEFWRSIKDGNDPEGFELYLQQFPEGIYARLARSKLKKIRAAHVGPAPEYLRADLQSSAITPKPRKALLTGASVIALVVLAGGTWWYFARSNEAAEQAKAATVQAAAQARAKAEERAAAEKALADEKEVQRRAEAKKSEEAKEMAEKVAAERSAAEQATKELERRAADARRAAEKAEADKLAAQKARAAMEADTKEKAERELARIEALKAEKAAAEKQAAEQAERTRVLRQAEDRDRSFWDSVKDSKNPDEFKAYLARFPDGLFATLAQTRITELRATTNISPAKRTAADLQVATQALKAAARPEWYCRPPTIDGVGYLMRCTDERGQARCLKRSSSNTIYEINCGVR